MELFYSADIEGDLVRLDQEESGHCVRVLRHRAGDEVSVIDGRGNLYGCRLIDADQKSAVARIESRTEGFGAHPYNLTIAVCPTKNTDRIEWFAEKATEIGVDTIAPVIGEHSERKVFKTDRIKRIVLSAAKQSLKGSIPEILEPVSVSEFIENSDNEALRLICYCFEGENKRISIKEELLKNSDNKNVVVLIGPEGDFSENEVKLALNHGWKPVHLGNSRLRTETAALTAVSAVYFYHSTC
ncbi:MAG: RsmE family RNA methyltransferase [Bacteroidia bacterium]|nr:RsmE family RNA methyltransferase [Bacteroidia bacterium]